MLITEKKQKQQTFFQEMVSLECLVHAPCKVKEGGLTWNKSILLRLAMVHSTPPKLLFLSSRSNTT